MSARCRSSSGTSPATVRPPLPLSPFFLIDPPAQPSHSPSRTMHPSAPCARSSPCAQTYPSPTCGLSTLASTCSRRKIWLPTTSRGKARCIWPCPCGAARRPRRSAVASRTARTPHNASSATAASARAIFAASTACWSRTTAPGWRTARRRRRTGIGRSWRVSARWQSRAYDAVAQ